MLHVLTILQLVVVLRSESRPTPDFFTYFTFYGGASCLSFNSLSEEYHR
jgi:hypothetical protein